ncbi:CheR family methyltransferase [Nocardioides pyridinolyticus]
MTDDDFEDLLRHIKEQRGFDFTGYKRASLARRVQRRMETVGLQGYEEYLDHLLLHPDEFTQLFNTILINVTSFYRDPDAWQYLQEELLPDLLRRREGRPIRVWSAGCASGQEAYSLAMVLAELLGLDEFRERVKIYATDVDEEALAQARQATYTEAELEGLPDGLRDKYLEPSGNRFVFRKELRRSVIFGRNDLVQDAPISHVDVMTCRNTLMYFNAETQNQILNRMHFALRPDGILFLGKAEMLLSHSAYFRPVELRRRFFTKVPTEPRDRRAMHQFGLTPRDIGRPIQDLEVSYRPVELRAHIEEARHERRAVWVRDVEQVRGGGETLSLDIQLVPLADDTGAEVGLTVIFTDVTQYRQLQNELTYANRQLEIAYEELQSTNEELETMNEELQSMNDELQFSNEALRDRQDVVERLNRFMTAVLGSMNAGVAVVDADMQILAWNTRAEDLWGVRTDEAVGAHLMNLDIGLPVEQLRQPIRSRLSSDDGTPAVLTVDAVNRRGRALQVQVTLTHIRDHGEAAPAAMLVMDVVESGD